jgi:hypothetical protein
VQGFVHETLRATAWPPVPAAGMLTAAGGAKASDLGTITRAGLPGTEDDERAALLHAVASSAEASGIPSLTGSGILASNEWIIFIVSFRAALSCGTGLHSAAALSICLTR